MQEEDPTAVEPEGPDDEALPPKPALEIPAEPVTPPTDEEEVDVDEDDVLPGEVAAADDTIDDAEAEEQPHDPATLDIAEDDEDEPKPASPPDDEAQPA